MNVTYNRKFKKQFQKAPAHIKEAFQERLRHFLTDPFQPMLNNHSLTQKWRHHRSINVTGDWRAIYFEFPNSHIEFRAIGAHSELYKK